MGNMVQNYKRSIDERELSPYLRAMSEPEHLDWKNGLSPEEIQLWSSRHKDLPVQITDTLFLSDFYNVNRIGKLESLGITHVLNVAGASARAEIFANKSCGIVYKEIDAHDEEGYDMLGNHLEECLAFINSCAAVGGKTVIHCVAGINRSGVIAAAVHLLTGGTTPVVTENEPQVENNILNTVAHCRRQRGNNFLWNHSFQLQLALLARKHNLLGAVPVFQSNTGEPLVRRREAPNLKSLFN